jgi:DNA-binding ferritin-like protein
MAKIADIKRMRELLTMFFCVADSAHLAHLNTRSFAQHKALGNFYEFAVEFKDRLIEYMIGMGYVGNIQLNSVEANEDPVSEAQDALEAIEEFAEEADDSTLENMAADFQEALGKLKYMLMLK